MYRLETQNEVTSLVLGHGKANALDLELCEALARALAGLTEARAVVLTGSGPIFSAGVDLKRILVEGELYVRAFLDALDRLLRALHEFPRPLVAAVNGHAIAGGAVIACAADRRLMAQGTHRIGVPELRVGVPFPELAFELVRSVLPASHLREALLLGRTYEPTRALAMGWVDELVPGEELGPRAEAVALELASIPAASYAHTKEQLRRAGSRRLAARSPEEARRVCEIWCSPEARAAIEAYVEATLTRRVR